jgi:hypothetical protein
MVSSLETIFPGLAKAPYQVTSPPSKRYNCIAWAAGDTAKWWWPGPNAEDEYWPPEIERLETLDLFQQVFASLGYESCASAEPETGFEKIALFADGRGNPKHAARQLPNGRWTSKLGQLDDIEHDLCDLEGAEYGLVLRVMRRALAVATAT